MYIEIYIEIEIHIVIILHCGKKRIERNKNPTGEMPGCVCGCVCVF